MLGYVKIDKGELKVREYEIYCGYYCGICKYIGKTYGQLPRMSLSYDAAFLAILLASLDETSDQIRQEHCVVHHIKKKTIIQNDAVEYAGDVMLILAWYKLQDDALDEGKLYAKVTMLLLQRIFKKLRKKYPKLCTGIETQLKALSHLEKERCANLDQAAEAFSKIMEVIFTQGVETLYGSASGKASSGNVAHGNAVQSDIAHGNAVQSDIAQGDIAHDDAVQGATKESGFLLPEEFSAKNLKPEEALAKIGYHLGKWIYLIDAIDDIEENLESGAYNPLLYRFSYDKEQESAEDFRKRIEERLRFNLFHYLAMVSNCLETLAISKNQGIIENVIYFGLNRTTEEIITRVDPAKEKRS